ncbi:MAG: hypothetical protein WCL27_14245 [Betaproteobacteria bacterium]
MRKDQDSSEIIAAGRQIKVVTKSQYDSSNPEKRLIKVRSIGYEQTAIRGSRDDFNSNFDRIFLTDKC